MKKNRASDQLDWHRADVISALKKAGWSVRELSRQAGLGETTLYAALDRNYPKGERIIANALGIPPEQIWPERYARRNFRPVFHKTAVNA